MRHTQHGKLVCGVGDGHKECWKGDSDTGIWYVSHTLDDDRSLSCTWPVEEGLLILGGNGSDAKTSAVLAYTSGGVEPAFNLVYETR